MIDKANVPVEKLTCSLARVNLMYKGNECLLGSSVDNMCGFG